MIGRWKQRGNHIATARLTVHRHLPWSTRLLRSGGLLLLVGFVTLGAYYYGRQQATSAVDNSAAANRSARSESEINELRQKLGSIEQQLRVELATRDTLSRQLQQYQTDNGALREQLAFYESLLTKTDRAPGLAIDSFRAEPLSPGHYRLKIVLVQGQSSQEAFKGELDFKLTYERGGRQESLVWPTKRLGIKVARFSLTESDASLPVDAKLRRVEVRVYAAGEGNAKLARSYDVKG